MSATETTGARRHKPLVFDVTGMDCGDCARSVERVVGQLPDVDRAAVSFATGTLTVDRGDDVDNHEDFVRSIGGAVDRAGYTAVLRGAFGGRRGTTQPWWKNRKLVPAAMASVLWIVAFVVGQLVASTTVEIALYAVAIAVGGFPIMRAGWTALRAGRIDMNVLMTISVIAAAERREPAAVSKEIGLSNPARMNAIARGLRSSSPGRAKRAVGILAAADRRMKTGKLRDPIDVLHFIIAEMAPSAR